MNLKLLDDFFELAIRCNSFAEFKMKCIIEAKAYFLTRQFYIENFKFMSSRKESSIANAIGRKYGSTVDYQWVAHLCLNYLKYIEWIDEYEHASRLLVSKSTLI